MPRIAIIKIGWAEFALPPKVDAAKLLAALTQAEHVKSRGYGRDEVFFPAPADRHDCASMELRYVDARQMRPSDPGDPDDDTTGPLRLKG